MPRRIEGAPNRARFRALIGGKAEGRGWVDTGEAVYGGGDIV